MDSDIEARFQKKIKGISGIRGARIEVLFRCLARAKACAQTIQSNDELDAMLSHFDHIQTEFEYLLDDLTDVPENLRHEDNVWRQFGWLHPLYLQNTDRMPLSAEVSPMRLSNAQVPVYYNLGELLRHGFSSKAKGQRDANHNVSK